MYYQPFYLRDEGEIIYENLEIVNLTFSTEFAIVLFDNSKKPYAFIEYEYSKLEKALGKNITLQEVIFTLRDLGFSKYTSSKSPIKLREEIEKRRDICYEYIHTQELCDYYNPLKDTIVARTVNNIKIIDLKSKEELLLIENYSFNMDNPSFIIIAEGIMKYTLNYYDTPEYEEVCRLEEEELKKQLEEEEKVREQERLRAEAEVIISADEAKRIEELINMKIKELEKQERK